MFLRAGARPLDLEPIDLLLDVILEQLALPMLFTPIHLNIVEGRCFVFGFFLAELCFFDLFSALFDRVVDRKSVV